MKTELVIARYNEDLSWIDKLPKTIKITIYNKGKHDIKYPFIELPNIGRESHTYLYHIINNYDSLAEQTIFCQGDSIFHSPDFINLIKNRKYFEPIQPLAAYYWPEGIAPNYFSNPPLPILEKTTNLWIKGNKVHVEYLDNEFKTRYPYFYYQDHFVKLINFFKKSYNIDNPLKFIVERFRLKNVDLNKLFPICYAGLFSVNKNVILENSIDFYNNIINTLIYDLRKMDHKIMDHGLFLEKLWLLIFNYKKNNKNYIDLNIDDYKIFDKELTINYLNNMNKRNNINKPNNINKRNNIKSIINFELFIIYCEVFINLYIDNKLYKIFFSRAKISFKDQHNNKLVHYYPLNNINIQEVLKDMSNINVKIVLHKNELVLNVNNLELIKYKFKYNLNKITNAKIISLTYDNKFNDLLTFK
jgi:hypothetical protein